MIFAIVEPKTNHTVEEATELIRQIDPVASIEVLTDNMLSVKASQEAIEGVGLIATVSVKQRKQVR